MKMPPIPPPNDGDQQTTEDGNQDVSDAVAPESPFLVRMSLATFDDIPNKVMPRTVRLIDPAMQSRSATTWIFIGYCEKLLSKNEKLQDWLCKFEGRLDDQKCCRRLTQGQRILNSLAALDGQINNGGIAQFFWNCPDLIFEVSEALKTVGERALADSYDKAIKQLIDNEEQWFELRKQASTDPNVFWEPFQESYDLLDLDWFDDAYFKKYSESLVTRLVNYVRAHKKEFVDSEC